MCPLQLNLKPTCSFIVSEQAQKLKVVKVEAQISSQYKRKGKPVEISKLRELKPSNYKDWFHSLLHLEEECIESHLEKLPQPL